MNSLIGPVEALLKRIQDACERFGRDPVDIELLPVSKHQSKDALREAAALGYRLFGENYVQEAVTKRQSMPDLEFVLIGPLQRNKAKAALQNFQEIMTIDRPSLAQRLSHLADEMELLRGLWIQVDLWNETTKAGGCAESDILAILAEIEGCRFLPFRGFMAIPPPGDLSAFGELSKLRERWQQKLGHKLRLSMGMSSDLEDAIRCGSDQIRVGTAFFGQRI